MSIILMRHGIAADQADRGAGDDAARPLTETGRKRTLAAARGLLLLQSRSDRLLSSPLLRARQTAEIVAGVFALPSSAIEECAELSPWSDPRETLARLRERPSCCTIAVGHAPNLDLTLGAALGRPRSPFTGLRKAGAALITFDLEDSPEGRLVWLALPRMLRALGREG